MKTQVAAGSLVCGSAHLAIAAIVGVFARVHWEAQQLHGRVDQPFKDFDFSGRLQLLSDGAEFYKPKSVDELQAFVKNCARNGTRLRVVGGSNSYSSIIQAPENGRLVSLWHLDKLISVDTDKKQITVQAGARERDVHDMVAAQGWSLPMVTRKFNVLAGGFNSGHHSSDFNYPEVASAIVEELTLVSGEGELLHAKRGDDLYNAAVVGLGRVGIVVQYTLQCRELFHLKAVGHQVGSREILRDLEERASKRGYWRVIFFPYTGKAWEMEMTSKIDKDEHIHSMNSTGGLAGTGKAKRVGSWKRFSDVIYDITTYWLSMHGYITRVIPYLVKPLNNIQAMAIGEKNTLTARRSDWMLAAGTGHTEPPHDSYEMTFPIEYCEAAVNEIHDRLEEAWSAVPWTEIRISGPSQAWLSGAYAYRICWFELPTYHQSEEHHQFVIDLMQDVADKYHGRPHWGKLNVISTTPEYLGSVFPKLGAWSRMVKTVDPHGVFSHPWFDHIVNHGMTLPESQIPRHNGSTWLQARAILDSSGCKVTNAGHCQ